MNRGRCWDSSKESDEDETFEKTETVSDGYACSCTGSQSFLETGGLESVYEGSDF